MSTMYSSQKNSYLRSSVNKVLSCTPVRDEKDNETFIVILDDSVLYPEGGGQPSDYGRISWFDPIGSVVSFDVLSVSKVEEPSFPPSSVQISLPASIPVGAEVESSVDWSRRYDHMQQHTAQHLFSGIAYKIFGADTVGWSLGAENVYVDLLLPRRGMLTAEEVVLLENTINEEIRKGSPVSWVVKCKDEFTEENGLIVDGAPLVLRGAPKGAALLLDELRFVCIGGLDANPCGGTHVRSLSELQLIKIISTEKDRESCRIRFLAGNRAISMLQSVLNRESQLSALLSVQPKLFTTTVEKLFSERKELEKKHRNLLSELAVKIGQLEVDNYLKGDESVLMLHRPGADLTFLQLLLESILTALSTSVTCTGKPVPLIFLSGDEGQSVVDSKPEGKKKSSKPTVIPLSIPVSGAFVMAGPNEIVSALKDEISTILDGRSGGRPGRLQGQAKNISIESLRAVKHLCQHSNI